MLLLGTSGKTTAIFFIKNGGKKKRRKKKDQELSSVTLGTQPLCTVYQKDELGKRVRGNSVH